MPAYNFKAKFVRPILTGEKCTTIRRRRKRATRPGETLMLYTGMRTKECVKFADAACVAVTPIVIWPEKRLMGASPENIFSLSLTVQIAKRDGFEALHAFFEFFRKHYGLGPLDDFEIIEWDPDTLRAGGRLKGPKLEAK